MNRGLVVIDQPNLEDLNSPAKFGVVGAGL